MRFERVEIFLIGSGGDDHNLRAARADQLDRLTALGKVNGLAAARGDDGVLLALELPRSIETEDGGSKMARNMRREFERVALRLERQRLAQFQQLLAAKHLGAKLRHKWHVLEQPRAEPNAEDGAR